MQIYSCKVLLGGSRYNEVHKPEVTVPEIYVLRRVHGEDAVLEIKPRGREAFDPGPLDEEGKPTKPVLRTEAAERDRLNALYDPMGKFIRQEVFGVGQPLPKVLEGVEVASATPVKRTRKKADAPAPPPAVENDLPELRA